MVVTRIARCVELQRTFSKAFWVKTIGPNLKCYLAHTNLNPIVTMTKTKTEIVSFESVKKEQS